MHTSYATRTRGAITVTALVFMGIFLMIFVGMTSTINTQRKLHTQKAQGAQALQIAEAGLDYYKWFLAHFKEDMTDGTGESGPYVHAYNDPEGGRIGQFSLQVAGDFKCGDLQKVTIASTGMVDENPDVQKTVVGEYGRPSVGEYSYILNSDVWAGPDRIINGPFHSNGGVRMDGTNYAQVTSVKTTWNCTSSYGCAPAQSSAPGVVGSGSGSSLWSWPVPIVDFGAVTLDLKAMKDRTASTTPGTCTSGQTWGCFFDASGGSNKGYYVNFLNDGRVAIYKVTAATNVSAYHANPPGWVSEPQIITNKTQVSGSPFTLPTACPILFIQDRVWVDGVVKGKVTLAAANPTGADYDVIINGNIDYTTLDGSDGLLAIGENRVLIPLDTPDDLTIRGIFIAQLGYFGRDHYQTVPNGNPTSPTNCGNRYSNCIKRDSMTIYGTVVSNGRVGTKWISGTPPNETFISGFQTRVDWYDSKVANDPPPLTPKLSDEYKFLRWEQTQ